MNTLNTSVEISICIPAYKNIRYVKRLLDSISIQTFTSYEVIITDDSPNDELYQLCREYDQKFTLHYFKNPKALDTPENWNEAIRKASGKWIKIMHDDDWFSTAESLENFANAIVRHPDCNFFFSAYANVYEGVNQVKEMSLSRFWKNALKNPHVLLADNVIGPPSVTLHKNTKEIFYDRSMKYIVDIDFYIRFLKNNKWCYIDKSLINVGINSSQVTKYTFGVAEVHLREALQLLKKTGEAQLHNILVFDAWWRLMRNFSIKKLSDIHEIGYEEEVPHIILSIVSFQQKISPKMLKIGPYSKFMMTVCYLLNRHKIMGS